MAPDLGSMLADLAHDQAALRARLRDLGPADWDAPTPSPGWTALHQIRHLAHGEALGQLAASDPVRFGAELRRLLADLDAVEAEITVPSAVDPPAAALDRWWTAAGALRAAVAAGPTDEPIGWVAGPMSRASFVTARCMETFAHGHDITVALGDEPRVPASLRHIAHLGVATRAFAFVNRGLPSPTAPLRVELTAPDGSTWGWGPEDASERVTGPALDFVRLVTQRVHRDDTALLAVGPEAGTWLRIAQCFAGPPTDGPGPARR